MSIRPVPVLALALLATSPALAQKKLTVSAGEFDRRATVVPVDVGSLGREWPWELRNDAGTTPLDVAPDGGAYFIIADLKAGQTETYRIVRSTGGQTGIHVAAHQEDGTIKVNVSGRHALTYQGKKRLPQGLEQHYERGGYIHPVTTQRGRVISDDFPPKHKHHHGIWSPWTKTKFEGRTPDFWNMFQKTGTVEVVDYGNTWVGRVSGGFTAEHRMVDLSAKPQAKTAINERWNVVAYGNGGGLEHFIFDWTTTQTCATGSPLLLPKYHYGGLGFRGHRDWDGKANCVFLTSEGKDRSNGNETTGKWCYVGGKVDGAMAGVAILCHPDNFRFPQPMRLHPDEPFFCYAPSQGGDWAIEPGKPYVAKYRFVVMDSGPDAKEIERLWNDYANPPKVAVE